MLHVAVLQVAVLHVAMLHVAVLHVKQDGHLSASEYLAPKLIEKYFNGNNMKEECLFHASNE